MTYVLFTMYTQLPLFYVLHRSIVLSDIKYNIHFHFYTCTQKNGANHRYVLKLFRRYKKFCFFLNFFNYKIHGSPLHGYGCAIYIEEYASTYGENSHYTMRNTSDLWLN